MFAAALGLTQAVLLTHARMLCVPAPGSWLGEAGFVVLGWREVVSWPGPEDRLVIREGLLCLRCVVGNCGCWTTGLGETKCPPPGC